MARCGSGGVAFSVLVHTDMSSPWLTRYGTPAQKGAYLPAIVRGETVCALGITEPGTGSDMAGIATRPGRGGEPPPPTRHQVILSQSRCRRHSFCCPPTRPRPAA